MANILAYYDAATITAVKSFIVQAPGWNETRNEIIGMRLFFEHLVETPFKNGKWELVISLIKVVNNIFCLFSVITISTL